MEKNAILAIALSIAVLLGFSYFFPTPQRPVEAVKAPAGPGAATAVPAGQPEGGAAAQGPAAPGNAPTASYVAQPEREIKIDTDLYAAVLSTRGGVIKSWKLKAYKTSAGEPSEMVGFKGGMLPLIVVPEGVGWQEAQGYPYQADAQDLVLKGKGEEGSINLTFKSPDGRSITKTLTFKNGTYSVKTGITAGGYAKYAVYMGENFGSLTAKDTKGYGFIGALTFVDGEKHKDGPKDLVVKKSYQGKEGWVAITDKYFMAAAIPEGGIKAVAGKGGSDWGYVGLEGALKTSFMLYAGPKEYDRLKALGHGLDKAVDFGWFTFLAKPVFVSLKFFYGLVRNYGWAIIIITFIIKLLFAPLTHKSQKSMKRMQKLQPYFAELKEKFKGDPQRLNREMMELYKKHKVNPMSGCLPMVIQIPVFIALYNVLNNSIELRQAPFMWWLHDLSAKDPYYVLPIVMGASMLLMQKMTPTAMDPKQNKIMMMMPVIMTFMFISLPSGLVLYFTVSNALSMAQQLYINKYSAD